MDLILVSSLSINEHNLYTNIFGSNWQFIYFSRHFIEFSIHFFFTQNWIFEGKILMQVILYSYFILKEIILYFEKNHSLFGKLPVATLIDLMICKYFSESNLNRRCPGLDQGNMEEICD